MDGDVRPYRAGDVSQYRLALHLTLACVIYAAMLWTARRLGAARAARVPPRIRASAVVLLCWCWCRSISARWSPGSCRAHLQHLAADRRALDPGRGAAVLRWSRSWRNLFENVLTVQFDHRMVGYVLCLRRSPARDRRRALGGEGGVRWARCAGRGDHHPGCARRPHAHLSAAALARARASGDGDRRPHDRGCASGTARAAGAP